MITCQNIQFWIVISILTVSFSLPIFPWLRSYVCQLFEKKQPKVIDDRECYNCAYGKIEKITEGMSHVICLYRHPCQYQDNSKRMSTVITTAGDCVNKEHFKQKQTTKETV